MPVRSDIHSFLLLSQLASSLLALMSSDDNALMAGMDGAVWAVRVLAECITQAPFDTAWLHLLALGDAGCNLLGALSLEFILRHI